MPHKLTLRAKLMLMALIPMIAVAIFAGLRIVEQFERSNAAAAQTDEVRRVLDLRALVATIEAEATLPDRPGLADSTIASQREQVDAALAAAIANPGNAVEPFASRLERTRQVLEACRLLVPTDAEELIAAAQQPETAQALLDIQLAATDLEQVALFDSDAFVSSEAAADAQTLLLFDRFDAALREEGMAYVRLGSLPAEAVTSDELERLVEATTRTRDAELSLRMLGSDRFAPLIDETLAEPGVQEAFAIRELAFALEPGTAFEIDAQELMTRSMAVFGRFDQLRNDMETWLLDDAARVGEEARHDAFMTLGGGLSIVGIILALLIILQISIRVPLSRLTTRSRDIASVELPKVVSTLQSDAGANLPVIAPIAPGANDEVGALIMAVNQMSRTAVQLAGEQASARRNIDEMFMNLGRRNQKMLNRLLTNLDGIERDEDDPDRLEALYQVDHLANRMRRNAESLLVLAGATQSRRWREPVPAANVIRSALAEVENYERVDISGDEDTMILGEYVADIAHILAELLENALTFSPPESLVEVVARAEPSRFVMAVVDHGVGMSPQQFDEMNERIAKAADESEMPSAFIGLFVVGRLAARRDITVGLAPGAAGGVTAFVGLPVGAIVSDEVEDAKAASALAALDFETPVIDTTALDADDPFAIPADDPFAIPDTPAAVVEADGPVVDEPVVAEPVVAEVAPAPAEQLALPEASVAVSPEPVAEVVPPAPAPVDPFAAGPSQPPVASVHAPPSPIVTDDLPPLEVRRRPDQTSTPISEPSVNGLNKFGTASRRPGANLPTTGLPSAGSSASAVAVDHDPAAVRRNLSGFQTGTRRAEQEGSNS